MIVLKDHITLKNFDFIFRKIQRKNVEGVARDGPEFTLRAINLSEILAIKNVYDKRLVSFEKKIPHIKGVFVKILFLVVFDFEVRLGHYLISIVHYDVKEVGQKFLRVLLRETDECLIDSCYHFFDQSGRNEFIFIAPHFDQKFLILNYESSS